jgi:two-component system, LytTR family, sensor kinase
MKSKYPFKKLSILNIWLISTCVFFVFAFVIVFQGIKGIHDAILGALLTLITLMLTGFANIMWLYFFKKQLAYHALNTKKIYYTISYTFSICIFLTVVVCFNYISRQPTDILELFNLIVVSIFVNTLVVTFHNYIVLQDAKVNSDMENSQLKAANAEAANQLLRQQIHPHFLFNALNILKSLYKIDPKAAEEYLVCLSDFLRASVSNNNIKTIRLEDELKLCQNYLNMQKIRFGDALICSVSITEEALENGFVPSFSIQPLLENAIKHNELTNESPLYIEIKQEGERIKVTNNLKPKITTETSTGSGLVNLSERYRILSNDELIIENDEASFSVSIKILSDENSNYRR